MSERFIELNTYRSAGVNAYLVEEGRDYTHNMYGTPIDEANQERAYRKKSHTIKVRIDNLPDGIYRFVEAGGSTGKKQVKKWLKIVNGEILEESNDLNGLIVGETVRELPRLEGSDTQVSWAENIRQKAIAKYKQSGEDIPLPLLKTTSAKWWIDNRSNISL